MGYADDSSEIAARNILRLGAGQQRTNGCDMHLASAA